ncbi:hypothetical protein HHK36_008574 [Tetracentron sinense]|uniref:CTLH domain-containing protein n=1 Tax=Tetracentron sinense TaxID=13715 RepID=A0A834ZIQ7_TETSI|nr:hypothetical protein HHK36_008574 [Tetracentron sinense]
MVVCPIFTVLLRVADGTVRSQVQNNEKNLDERAIVRTCACLNFREKRSYLSSISNLEFLILLKSMMDLDPRDYEHVVINDNDIRNIVLSYLVHNCFKETAESFIACTGMKQPADYPVDMEKRKRRAKEQNMGVFEVTPSSIQRCGECISFLLCSAIFHFALEGNVLKAIELTDQLAHDLLEENKDLHFDLLSLHFVELVCSRKCTEALEFAQTKLTPFGKVQKYVEKLEDFMALLAYEEPEKSPMFHLLGLEYRQHVADSLNRAILAHANLPSNSAMERLVQQTTVVRQCLHQELDKVPKNLSWVLRFLDKVVDKCQFSRNAGNCILEVEVYDRDNTFSILWGLEIAKDHSAR